MNKQHHYSTTINWTGNRGEGTINYKSYDRDHVISIENKQPIQASSDPAFMGDPSRYNPEELLLASLSSCHMLWYLHLCADAGVIVTHYSDKATGTMEENNKGGRFIEVILHPQVRVADISMADKAMVLHQQANEKCFIANSCNFPVHHQPDVQITE
jgi:organic hydroperoxide reductase OsmC/OhrA